MSTDTAAPHAAESDREEMYVVGIGASAGGLDALTKFFSQMPPDSGMAFVVVQHLSPDPKSLMSELLAKHTDMPVQQAQDGEVVHANHDDKPCREKLRATGSRPCASAPSGC